MLCVDRQHQLLCRTYVYELNTVEDICKYFTFHSFIYTSIESKLVGFFTKKIPVANLLGTTFNARIQLTVQVQTNLLAPREQKREINQHMRQGNYIHGAPT
jgi:hypothetical protein